MTQNFLQPKGMLKPQIGIEDLTKQYAQIFTKPQAQEQTQDPLRQTVQELVKNNLMNQIEIPKPYTTIQEVFNANNGDRFKALGEWFNSPQFNRMTGGDFTFNPVTKRMESSGEKIGREQETRLNADREKALEQQKQQLALANNVYDAYNRMDIANEQNKLRRELAEQEQKWRTEEAEKDRAFRRGENAANRAQQLLISKMIHGGGGGGGSSSSGGGGTVTGGAAGLNLNNIKMTAADRKSLTENKTTLANIEAGLKSLDANPKAYSFLKGIMGPDVTNRLDPKGVATRTQIDNITAVYRKWLTGAQMSDKERKAYERFLPAPTDNYTIVKSKLEGMRGAVQRSNDALLSNYGISATDNADPMGLGL